MRGLAVAEIYGTKQAVMAVLIPPLLPIRMVWGNIINFTATLRAWRIFLFGSPTQQKKWAKTEHKVYAPELFLKAYRHKIGDLAIQNEIITSQQLQALLLKQKQTGKPLGKLLLEDNLVDEVTYTQLISQHFNLAYLNLTSDNIDPTVSNLIPHSMADIFRLVPLVASRTTMIIAVPEPLTDKVIDTLVSTTKRRIIQVLTPPSAVDRALEIIYSTRPTIARTRLGRKLLQSKLIDEYQLIDALETGGRLGDILVSLGYIESEQIDRIMS
jgi:adsorption protein B